MYARLSNLQSVRLRGGTGYPQQQILIESPQPVKVWIHLMVFFFLFFFIINDNKKFYLFIFFEWWQEEDCMYILLK